MGGMVSHRAAGSAQVSVSASDDSSGIQTVVIAYTDGTGAWSSVSLLESGGGWSGSFPANDATVFFIQAVDGAGNVTVDANAGQYYAPGDSSHTFYLPYVTRSN